MANNLTRMNPLADLTRFDAFRDFEDIFKSLRLGNALGEQVTGPRITLDVTENEQAYVVNADVPGAKKEDVKVTVDGNTVTIRVETKRDNEEKQGETVLRRERYFGVQTRSFSVTNDIDESQASAKYQDGVLELVLPKRAGGAGAKLLEIS
jgi:HSP20 family protein